MIRHIHSWEQQAAQCPVKTKRRAFQTNQQRLQDEGSPHRLQDCLRRVAKADQGTEVTVTKGGRGSAM